jgi:predicted nucleotidyltransferase
VLSGLVTNALKEFLHRVDRAIPGRVEGFYIVGSACMGAFRPGRSDIDFVAVVERALQLHELRRLRHAVLQSWTLALSRDLAVARRWPLACNGVYVLSEDLAQSALAVVPIASHVASRFTIGRRF